MQLCPDILKDISVKDQEGWSNMISAGHSFHSQNPTNQVCNLLLSAWFDIVLKFCWAWKYHCHALRKFSKGFDRYGCSVQTISWSRTDFLYCNGPQKRTKFCPTPCTLHYSYSKFSNKNTTQAINMIMLQSSRMQRCQHSIFEMLNDFEIQQKCLTHLP